METYANVLLIALPSFMVLILIEIIYGIWKKDLTYNLMDTISSLSSDHQIFERYHKFRLKNGYAKKQSITLKELALPET